MKKIWLISGAMVSCLLGAVVGACGSSTTGGTGGTTTSTGTSQTTSTGNPTTSSSGNTTTSSSGNTTTSSSGNTTTSSSGTTSTSSSSGTTSTSSSSGTTSTSSSSSSASSSGTCQSDPTLHTNPNGSIFCGFGADGGSLTCMTGQECCIGGSLGGGSFAPDECDPWGNPCPNPAGQGLPVVCEQPGDCTANGKPAGTLCCLMGSTPAPVPGCDPGDIKASKGTGTQCVAANANGCGTGNTQLCLQQSDCPTGTTCTPFRWKIIQLGYCK